MHLVQTLKPILVELLPLILLAFGWFAVKNMGKKPGGNWLDRRLMKLRWEDWLLTVIAAMALAMLIMKAVL